MLVDAEDRENEGDLVVPAQMATPDVINFMAKHARGLICLALTRERVEQLGLPPVIRDLILRPRGLFLVTGPTGSGKTNLLHQLIAQDIVRRHAIAGHDLRGDFLGTGVELCAGRVDPSLVKILNLREKNRAFGFNPLTGSGEPDIRALHTLDVIMETTDATGVQLLETMRNGLQLVAETGQPLTELENLFYDRSFRYRCLERW